MLSKCRSGERKSFVLSDIETWKEKKNDVIECWWVIFFARLISEIINRIHNGNGVKINENSSTFF